MNIIVVTPPPVEPVTWQQVYDHLRLVPDDDSPPTHPQDEMLQRLMKVATGDCERITHRAFVEQTVRIFMDGFPRYGSYWSGDLWFHRRGPGYIELLRPPVVAVVAVNYYDDENAAQSVAAESYYVTDDLVPRLYFGTSFTAPSYYARPDALSVDYIVGYPPDGSPAEDYRANVPEEIKHAILISVEMLYRTLDPKERESLERARDSLLSDFVVHTIA